MCITQYLYVCTHATLKIEEGGRNPFHQNLEDMQMSEVKNPWAFVQIFWTAFFTIIILCVVGFNWWGWETSGSAKTMAQNAVVESFSDICVYQAKTDSDEERLAVVGKIKITKWDTKRIGKIREYGWDIMPGQEKPTPGVVDKCSKKLPSG